jgi:hypothetical protein
VADDAFAGPVDRSAVDAPAGKVASVASAGSPTHPSADATAQPESQRPDVLMMRLARVNALCRALAAAA